MQLTAVGTSVGHAFAPEQKIVAVDTLHNQERPCMVFVGIVSHHDVEGDLIGRSPQLHVETCAQTYRHWRGCSIDFKATIRLIRDGVP